MTKGTDINVFDTLNKINVNEHTEEKGGLTYLSWAWAWQEVKKKFPNARYTIYEDNNGMFYHTDGHTCWVKTGVTIEELEHIEYLPVMDFKNKSIPLEKVTSTDVNKAIQRSLTKACARHGLGLYIYAGEDLPDAEQTAKKVGKAEAEKNQQLVAARKIMELKGIKEDFVCKLYGADKLEDLTKNQLYTINKQADAFLKKQKETENE